MTVKLEKYVCGDLSLRSSVCLTAWVLWGYYRQKLDRYKQLGLIAEMLLNKILMGIDKLVFQILESLKRGISQAQDTVIPTCDEGEIQQK